MATRMGGASTETRGRDMMAGGDKKGLRRIAEVAQFKKDNQYCVCFLSHGLFPYPSWFIR